MSALGQPVEDPHDLTARASHDPGGGVPQAPAQGFGLGDGEGPGEAEQLEPAHEIGGVADEGEPGPVGVETAEREPQEPGRLESSDVILDLGVGAHVRLPGSRLAVRNRPVFRTPT
jgi:hypothetical protein